jgi:hypothetical protein
MSYLQDTELEGWRALQRGRSPFFSKIPIHSSSLDLPPIIPASSHTTRILWLLSASRLEICAPFSDLPSRRPSGPFPSNLRPQTDGVFPPFTSNLPSSTFLDPPAKDTTQSPLP